MKKFISLILCASCVSSQIFSQGGEIVRIKPGDDPASTYSAQGFYKFATFREGIAMFKNGQTTTARFNFHLLNQEMQFIAANGDTLAIADPVSIKKISIDSNLYYYSDGYLEVIADHEPVKLARKSKIDVSAEKIGAYGQPSPSGSIRTPNRLLLRNNGTDLTINQEMLLRKEFSYFWLDKYGTVLRATKANLFKLIPPDNKPKVEQYLKENKINFLKEEDLLKVLAYSLNVK